jgi:hypothetical protein
MPHHISFHLKTATSLCPHIISSCDASLPHATCLLVFCSALMPGVHITSYEANTIHLPYRHHYNDFLWLLSSGIWPHVVWYVGTFKASVPVYQSTQYHLAGRQICGHGHENLRSHIITAIILLDITVALHTHTTCLYGCYLQECWQNHCQGIALMLIIEMFS